MKQPFAFIAGADANTNPYFYGYVALLQSEVEGSERASDAAQHFAPQRQPGMNGFGSPFLTQRAYRKAAAAQHVVEEAQQP